MIFLEMKQLETILIDRIEIVSKYRKILNFFVITVSSYFKL